MVKNAECTPLHVAPGTVIIESVPRPSEQLSKGGIIMPDAGSDYDKVKYGVVRGCGTFVSHTGALHPDCPGFPLPPGALIEIKNHNPWKIGKELAVKTEDITRWALPNEPRPYWCAWWKD